MCVCVCVGREIMNFKVDLDLRRGSLLHSRSTWYMDLHTGTCKAATPTCVGLASLLGVDCGWTVVRDLRGGT